MTYVVIMYVFVTIHPLIGIINAIEVNRTTSQKQALPITQSSPNFTTSIIDQANETNQYDTFFVIFFCSIFAILGVLALCACNSVNESWKIINGQFERTAGMDNFAKVISVENPSAKHENSQGVVELPVVNLKYEPSSNSDPTVEFELKADKKWEFQRKNLKFEQIVGEGAFGVVIKAEAYGIVEKNINTKVAIKMLKAQHCDTDMLNLVIEMEVMKMVGKHKNILHLLGCCTQGGPLLVIMEFVERGNLRDFLRLNRPSYKDQQIIGMTYRNSSTLSEKTLVSFALQIATGMEYLASRKFIHRDLAARNILVTEDFTMKIADFGLARDIHNNDYYRKMTEGALPVKWMAPEALCLGIYTTQTDVWSYGVLLWEVMTLGDTPYPLIPSDNNFFLLLRDGYRMENPQFCSENVYIVMRNCWNYQPKDRPQFSDLVVTLEEILMKTTTTDCMDVGFVQFDTPPNSQESAV